MRRKNSTFQTESHYYKTKAMSAPRETTNAIANPSGATATQLIRQRNQQLTTLTLLKLTMLTVLIYLPANSRAASINAPKASSSSTTIPAITVLPSVSADNTLSNGHPAVLQQLADSMSSSQWGRRKRLRKRHSDSIRLGELAAMTDELKSLEWLNACGGQQVGPPNRAPVNNTYVRKELLLLKKSLRDEHIRLNKLQKINIGGMGTWRLHKKKYRFLPLLNRTNKIDLRHWHHAMQKFVASFVELGVQQYRWEQMDNQRPTDLSHELNLLLLSAKRVLCDVETAFKVKNSQENLPTISLEEMQRRLNFYSRDEKRLAGRGVVPLDLKFAKQRYYRYVQRMSNILRSHLKSNRAVARASAKSLMHSNESSSHWAVLSQLLDYSAAEASNSEAFAQAANVAGSNEYSLGA